MKYFYFFISNVPNRYIYLLYSFLFIYGPLPGQDIYVERKAEKDSFVLYLVNETYMPLYVKVTAKENVPADSRVYSDFVLPGKVDPAKIMTIPLLSPEDTLWLKEENFGNIRLHSGDPLHTTPDATYLYGLPFQKKKSYKLIQGFNGKFSHQEPPSRYALDFDMPQGAQVCAAREGVVVRVKEDSNEGGPSPKYRGKDNHVVILHEDGTLGYYVHLQYEGALVEAGDRVTRGQVIGLSGNTGYSTRPHLHFVIRKPTKDGPIAIPFVFDEYENKKLKVGKMIKRKQ